MCMIVKPAAPHTARWMRVQPGSRSTAPVRLNECQEPAAARTYLPTCGGFHQHVTNRLYTHIKRGGFDFCINGSLQHKHTPADPCTPAPSCILSEPVLHMHTKQSSTPRRLRKPIQSTMQLCSCTAHIRDLLAPAHQGPHAMQLSNATSPSSSSSCVSYAPSPRRCITSCNYVGRCQSGH